MDQESIGISGKLVIDLAAIVENWRYFCSLSKGAVTAAVVKADAYGLGAKPVATALYKAGCDYFFVASVEEGVSLRAVLGGEPTIFVLNGFRLADKPRFINDRLVPVINTAHTLEQWQSHCQGYDAAIMVDTGINRLGLSVREFERLCSNSVYLKNCNLKWLISHFACADVPDHPKNAEQAQSFARLYGQVTSFFPSLKASLSNTAGIVLGAEHHYQLTRPGIGLYGGSPALGAPLPLKGVVTLNLPVLQLKQLDLDGSVGYGAAASVKAGDLLATVFGGYADGLLRSLGGRGHGYVCGRRVPMVGRVSMDYCVFNLSSVADELNIRESYARGELAIELIGPNQSIDQLAVAARTLPYELLTALGTRYERQYLPFVGTDL